MNLSPAFHQLRSAYQAELDDLSFDSEGRDVLRQRLADKRKSVDFLLQMTEVAPEMVAPVFHQAFGFKEPGLMNQLVSLELDDLPEWDEVSASITLAPWATSLAQTFLKQADGQRFMVIAAALAYLHDKPGAAGASASGDDDDEYDDEEDDGSDHLDSDDDRRREHDDDGPSPEEAGADWLEQQGFDRKD